MTDSQATEALPNGVLAALKGLLSTLVPSLPSKDTVWMAVMWLSVTGFSALGGALGWHWASPIKEVKVVDQSAVVATQQAESARANERIAFIAENRDLDGLAEKCGQAVKDAIKSSKKK